MEGFFLFSNVINHTLEAKIINIIETDPRFLRYMKTGKVYYHMSPNDYPNEWNELLNIIGGLHESCRDFDYSLQLKYEKGVSFSAHYDSKKRWEENKRKEKNIGTTPLFKKLLILFIHNYTQIFCLKIA